MQQFRKIIVDQIEYKWQFRYSHYDYGKSPYLLIVMKSASSRKAALLIRFRIKEHFLLNYGLPAVFSGIETKINLNCPFIVSQIIRKCREDETLFTQDRYKTLDGLEILQQIGYKINEKFI